MPAETSIKEILKAAFVTGRLTVIRILTGFGRSKLNAVILGAAGLGLYSQANYFFLFLSSICSLGLVNGMMQRISFNRERGLLEEQKNVQATVLTTQLILLVLLLLASFFFMSMVNRELFGGEDQRLGFFIFLIVLAIPFSVVTSNYIEGIFFSYGRYDLYTKASIVATIGGFIFFIPLVYFWGVYGAFASILVSAITLFFSYLYYVQKIERLTRVFVFGFQRKIFFNILPEGLVNLFYGALVPFSALLIRNLMIKYEGAAENGLYQICTSITALYIPFLTNPLWAKLFPDVSAKGESKESSAFFYHTILFVTLASTVCIVGLFIKPDLIIYMLSSKEFVRSVHFFPIYFLGDFFFNIFFVYSVYLLALRKVKEYLLIWLSYFAVQYVLSRILIGEWGAVGIPAAYAACSSILLIYLFFVLYRLFAENFSRYGNIFMACLGVVLVEGGLLYYEYYFLIKIAVFVAWLACMWVFQKQFLLSMFSKPARR